MWFLTRYICVSPAYTQSEKIDPAVGLLTLTHNSGQSFSMQGFDGHSIHLDTSCAHNDIHFCRNMQITLLSRFQKEQKSQDDISYEATLTSIFQQLRKGHDGVPFSLNIRKAEFNADVVVDSSSQVTTDASTSIRGSYCARAALSICLTPCKLNSSMTLICSVRAPAERSCPLLQSKTENTSKILVSGSSHNMVTLPNTSWPKTTQPRAKEVLTLEKVQREHSGEGGETCWAWQLHEKQLREKVQP